MQFRADLHCHTSCSDGSMTPTELVLHAKKVGLSGLSITDHDTVAAYEEAILAANKVELLLGSGIELSSHDGEGGVHILGYNISLSNKELKELCEEHKKRRLDRNRKILKNLRDKGMVLDEEFLTKGIIVGRVHIASELVKRGYVKSFREAFQRFIGDGKPCFDSGDPIPIRKTIEVIHSAGGKAFLAHPHLLPNGKRLKKLLEHSFDGIECYYSRFLPYQERPWILLAKERGLLISGGSDFHGAFRPDVSLGCSWVNLETFNKIFT